jgi:hypothetical protein
VVEDRGFEISDPRCFDGRCPSLTDCAPSGLLLSPQAILGGTN